MDTTLHNKRIRLLFWCTVNSFNLVKDLYWTYTLGKKELLRRFKVFVGSRTLEDEVRDRLRRWGRRIGVCFGRYCHCNNCDPLKILPAQPSYKLKDSRTTLNSKTHSPVDIYIIYLMGPKGRFISKDLFMCSFKTNIDNLISCLFIWERLILFYIIEYKNKQTNFLSYAPISNWSLTYPTSTPNKRNYLFAYRWILVSKTESVTYLT